MNLNIWTPVLRRKGLCSINTLAANFFSTSPYQFRFYSASFFNTKSKKNEEFLKHHIKSIIGRKNGINSSPFSNISGVCSIHSSSPALSEVKTVQDVIQALVKKVGATSSHTETVDRTHLKDLLPTSQDELPERTMADSYDEAIVPLGTSSRLREKYITFMGGVRIGRLLEDLDVFAVWICYNHVLNPKQKPELPSAYSIVTGLVDRIDFDTSNVLKPDLDIKLSGCVTWAGTTSMEVVISIQQIVNGAWQEFTRAVFVMVARNPTNSGSAIVNKLVATTKEETEIIERGNLNKLNRKLIQEESLFKIPPNETEKTLVHNLFMQMATPSQLSFAPKHKPENSVWLENTKLKNLIICHPEHRNRFKKVFGGFIMRQATEITWACAHTFSKQRPLTVNIDDIMFRSPVEIGSLLYFNSQVVYTEGRHMQVSTKASVMDPVTGTQRLTNIFHFTYIVDTPLPLCIPRTYHEAMMYLDGRRRFQMAMKERKFYGQGETESDAKL